MACQVGERLESSLNESAVNGLRGAEVVRSASEMAEEAQEVA